VEQAEGDCPNGGNPDVECDEIDEGVRPVLPFDLMITDRLKPGQFAISMPSGDHYLFAVLDDGVVMLGVGRSDVDARFAVVRPSRAVMLAHSEETRFLSAEVDKDG